MRMGSRCPLCPHVTGWKTTALPAASDFSKLLSSSAVALLLAVLEQDEQRAQSRPEGLLWTIFDF